MSPLQISRRLNKAGFHFQYEVHIRGYTNAREQLFNVVQALNGFDMNGWTAYHVSDRMDYYFDFDRLCLAFFFEEEAKPFLLMLSAMGHLEDEMEARQIR